VAAIQKATAGTAPVASVQDRQYLAPFIAIVLAALLVGGALFVVNEMGRAAAPAIQAGAVTDGWLPSVTAASEAGRLQAAERAVDGWSARLLAGSAASDVTDGWASRYLVAAQEATDGWATRYLVADD
jgi:hypothetical protein